MTLDELKAALKTYYQTNKKGSTISLTVDSETNMGSVRDVKDAIGEVVASLCNELAVKLHKRSFDELTELQQQEIKKIYPSAIGRNP